MTDVVGHIVGSARDRLAQKRAELEAAQGDLAAAYERMDTDTVVAARMRVDALEGFVTTLEVDAALEVDAEARDLAGKRVLGCRKGVASLAATMAEDVRKIVELEAQLREAYGALNTHYLNADRLMLEAAGLIDRFDLPDKAPNAPAPPSRRGLQEPLPDLLDERPHRPHTEGHPDDNDERRRTFKELDGTDAYSIIQMVGPKPWRLDPKHAAILQRRKEQDAQMRARWFGAVEAQPSPVPPGGSIPLASTL